MGRLPARWQRGLGTMGLVALPRFLYRAVFQALPACWPALQGLAQGLRVLLGEKERSRGWQDVRSRSQAVPFTTQTRLTFDVVLPLWGHRGPRPTPPVCVHNGRLSARERQR